jgi:hypothetical protein
MKGYVEVSGSVMTGKPAVSGSVTTAWGSTSPLDLGNPVVVSPVVVRSGTTLSVRAVTMRVGSSVGAQGQVGSIEGLVDNKVAISWPVLSAQAVDGPGFFWRLQHD